LLLQALFSVRSERQLMQQITYNMLFRWFIGLAMDAPVWDVTVFTKNRDRLLEGDIARGFLTAILADQRVAPLLSSEHFSVDGTLIEAWASMKSFRPKDGSGAPPDPGRNGERDFHGERRSNETHASTTDPAARLFRKSSGQPAQLCHMGHLLMENRSGLMVDARLSLATGTAEREIAAAMLGDLPARGRITVGADKLYDTQGFVAEMRRLGVTPHVTQHTNGRRSAVDRRTTRHAGYAASQRIRKRIEEGFGWIKTIGGLRKTRHRGTARVGWQFILAAAAYNLVRIPKLLAAA
jgi:IS5 family transposase